MPSTFTTYANLEKFEDRSVGWDFGNNLDTIDQGIGVHNLTNSSGGDINAFQPVAFDTATDNTIKAADLTAAGDSLADGLTLAQITDGASGQVLTRGFVNNALWSWTRGDVLYLNTAGGVGLRGSTTIVEQTSGEELVMQPVGIATSANRAYFDFSRRPGYPYTINSDGYTVSSGSAPESFASVSGPGSIRKLAMAAGAVVVFGFRLPGWFQAIPNITGIWGFRIGYLTASGSLDITNIYDGAGNSGDPGVSPGSSATWANLDCDWDQMAGVAGISFGAGDSVYVELTASTATVDVEVVPALRFEPLAHLAVE